jgi:crotonyl-CoA carboxylase/reductase
MDNVRRYRALASLCRQQAAYRPLQSWELLGQAEHFEYLAEVELKAHFDACNAQHDEDGVEALTMLDGNRDVDMVFEHPGEATFPVSVFVVKRGGMVAICAGTSGFNLTMDARFLWMRQKRVQGSHFANLMQASAANQLVIDRRVDPCLSEVFPWNDIPAAHEKMLANQHLPGNMGVLVCAQRPGLRTFEEVQELSGTL